MTERLILVGKILGAHGLKGLVKLASYTGDPEDIAAYGPLFDKAGTRSWDVTLNGVVKQHFIAQFSGVDSREAVDALKGVELYVPRSRLPKAQKGEYYYVDLIGLKARLQDGTAYGEITDMVNYGAGDILVITREGVKEMISYNKVTVKKVDLDGGFLVVDPPEYSEAKGGARDE